PRLYRNNGNGTFTEVTSSAGLYIYGEYSAGLWFDYDNDGDLDLVLMQFYSGYPVKLMNNNGNGTFTDITSISGINVDDCSSGIVADYNNDGFLDILFVDCENWSYKAKLYKNNGNPNHWFQIELEGVISNRDGIGARIKLFTGNLTQIREVMAGGEGGSQHMKRVHFGLGSYVVIDSIIVKWPSGVIDKIYNLPADTILYLVEGSTNLKETRINFENLLCGNISKNRLKIKITEEIIPCLKVSLINLAGESCKFRLERNGDFVYLFPLDKKFKSGIYILKFKIKEKILTKKILIF
ncbi:MAG: CRTAC1 family protein, partial [candidate division WOR-3 bacterium]